MKLLSCSMFTFRKFGMVWTHIVLFSQQELPSLGKRSTEIRFYCSAVTAHHKDTMSHNAINPYVLFFFMSDVHVKFFTFLKNHPIYPDSLDKDPICAQHGQSLSIHLDICCIYFSSSHSLTYTGSCPCRLQPKEMNVSLVCSWIYNCVWKFEWMC